MNEYIDLLKSPGHWLFEITLMLIFDFIIGIIIWPFIKHLWKDHKKFHTMKTYKVKKSEMIAEHKRIIPELKKAGLKKEAAKQSKELKSIKKK